MKIGISLLTAFLTLCCSILLAEETTSKPKIKNSNIKPRVIVTTDGEIDDRSSFIRYLLYTNNFNTEAIIPTNSKWQLHGHGRDWIFKQLHAYQKVFLNLRKHDQNYPHPNQLRNSIFLGNEDINKLHYVGPDNDTEGSKRIIRILLKDDPRPVWVLAWGGTNTIAQALWRLKESFPEESYKLAAEKIRIYAISFQDSTGNWIRENCPEALMIRDYQFMCINYQHEGHPYSDHFIFDPAWITENVKTDHGPLGALYPQTYQSEGDSPSFFHLMNTGLRSTANPAYGGWGGRHIRESDNFWVDAKDDGDKLKPLWRFLLDISNDFAARMDWCVNDFENANHPPVAVVEGNIDRTVPPGQDIVLDAGASHDPDHDQLSFKWWQYKDAGSAKSDIEFRTSGSGEKAKIVVPDEPGKSAHIILEVTDNGSPKLKHYQRIILNIQ